MILRRQRGDGAGGLRHAIALEETGLGDGADRLAQKVERDRGGAIKHIFDRRHVGRLGARMLDDHLQGSRNDEQAGDALFEPVENAIGREFGLHDRADTRPHRHDAESRSANMSARHADQDGFVLIEQGPRLAFFLAGNAERKQVAIGEHRALGIAGRARGVELEHGIVRSRRIELRLFSFVDGGDRIHLTDNFRLFGQFGYGLGGHVLEPLAQKQDFRSCVLKDVGDLRSGKAPADRHHHHAHSRSGIEQFEVMARILAEPGDPIALFHPVASQHPHDLATAPLEFGVGDRVIALFQHNRIRSFAGPVRNEFVESKLLFAGSGHRHCLPRQPSCHAWCGEQGSYCQRPPARARRSLIKSHRTRPNGPAINVANRIGAWTSREYSFASASRAIQSPTNRSNAR